MESQYLNPFIKEANITLLDKLIRCRKKNEFYENSESLWYAIQIQQKVLQLIFDNREKVWLSQLMKEVNTYSSLRQRFHQLTHEYHSFKELVVIADEDAEMQQLMHKILQQDHFIVLSADSGHETLKLVQYQPQIIILDVYKPIHSLEVCRRLRRTIRFSKYCNIPIIVFSALLSKNNHKKILELAVDWIAKPTQMCELIKLIYRQIPQTRIEMII